MQPKKETLNSETTRRQLMKDSLTLAGIGPLCCTTPELRPTSLHYRGAVLIVDLKQARELRKRGCARVIVDPGRKLNIIVANAGQNHFVALDRTCTHGGALCSYNSQRRSLQCTSLNHAEYDLHGVLLHGRTHGNLRAYEVRLTGTSLEIALEKKA